ncbi:MAG TPA: pirin family protein, partial [Thermoanaerobaculia bacterium]|nr:pirin family protein [Thermoanaerobaculia bacterium]
EKNASDELVHLLQIWILPERHGITPSYEQKVFPPAERDGRLRLVASHDGRDGSVTIHQDADLYTTTLRDNATVTQDLRPGRYGWVQVARGTVTVNGKPLTAGDGAAIEAEPRVTIAGDGEVLLFDLA